MKNVSKPKKQDKSKRQSVTYARKRISFNYPVPIRKGVCKACHRSKHKNEIQQTSLHHTKYAFELKTVRANPVLAIENTIELCYTDHIIGDSLRGLLLSSPRGGLKSINRIIQVVNLLPKDQQKHFTKLCKSWLRRKRK